MIPLEVLRSLSTKTPSKIVLVVIDGLGGVPHPDSGLTELEAARTPTLDALAVESVCGVIDIVGPGITPGSGAGHLALFGYDPITYNIGRGALSAFGLDFALQPNDVAARANFCTVDESGIVTDRRAGRIPTELNRELCQELRKIEIPGVELFVETESGHRALVVFRGEGLSDRLTDTDPLVAGQPIQVSLPLDSASDHMADIANAFSEAARRVLADKHPANALVLRGFAKHPSIPTFPELYKLTPAAIAAYPMYRGVGRLVGMEAIPTGNSIADEVRVLNDVYDKYDYFFLHIKYADSAGEDGDFDRKVAVLEEADRNLPDIIKLNPDVLVVTGDHSTPAVLRSHSWHPVPLLLNSPSTISDRLARFDERSARTGSLGRFPAPEAMSLMMGYAGKLSRYGA
jgi:2,3-bisphosphoglycerate-independent phosphoglycerate mutase